MPLPTLMAARQQGEVTGATAAEDPTADLDALREAGIDLDDVTAKLLRDGIDAFMVPMAKLLDGIERKREAIVTRRPAAIEADLPLELEQPLAERVKRAHDEDVARRIWERDGTLWAPDGTPEVTDRLGWLTIADKMLEEADTLDAFVAECKADGLTDVVLLGMGGSSLAPEVFRLSYGPQERRAAPARPRLDRAAADRGRRARDRRREDAVHRLHQVGRHDRDDLAVQALPRAPAAMARTSCSSPTRARRLLDLAEENGFRRAFQNDPEIGGRYSALSYFGIVPAALAGIDVRPLLEGAQVAAQACSDFDNPENNAGLWLGLALGELARAGRDKLTFVVDDPIASFGVWVEQLVAESTGKQGPRHPAGRRRAAPARRRLRRRPRLPPPPQHGRAGRRARRGDRGARPGRAPDGDRAGARPRRPRARVLPARSSRPPWSAGCSRSTRSTSPTSSRPRTPRRRVLDRGRAGRGRGRPRHAVRAASSRRPTSRSWATCPYSEEIEAAITRLREKVIATHHVATTYGYGPRFLHSTGQFHKGGPAGRALPPARARRGRRRRHPRRASSTSGR